MGVSVAPVLTTRSFGPFAKGVIDSANPSLGLDGACRTLRNGILSGINRLSIRPGTQVRLTLQDDQGSPANVTSVRAAVPFADGALCVGYSSVTLKAYLYRTDSLLTGYYDTGGAFHASATAAPIAVLWTGMTVAPDVQIAEGLGTAYIAHTAAADATGLFWRTRAYTDFNTIVDLVCNGSGGSAGTDNAYFTGVISFNQALWGFGFGSGAIASTGYRPELLRFSPPSFGNLQLVDSITVGDRVRSQRERVIGAGLAGESMIIGASNFVSQVTGYGRDSWFRKPIDRSYGFVGPKAFVTAGDTLYYWSRRGPMRIDQGGVPEPLWDALPATVNTIINTSQIVLGFDPDRDQVLCLYDNGSGVRTFAAFDVRRDVWSGPDNELGLVVACAGTVEPYVASTATPPNGPSGPPTSATNTGIGQTTSTAGWTTGDTGSQTEVSLGTFASGTFSVVTNVAVGVTSYTFTGLTPSTTYQWRVRHLANGLYSAYLTSSFATLALSGPLNPPTNPGAVSVPGHPGFVTVSWVNSGEAGVQTEVWHSSDNVNFTLTATVAVGSSSTTIRFEPSATTMYYKMRHAKSGSTSSAFTSTVSAVPE